jgi:hypothetical protein
MPGLRPVVVVLGLHEDRHGPDRSARHGTAPERGNGVMEMQDIGRMADKKPRNLSQIAARSNGSARIEADDVCPPHGRDG